MTDNHHPHPDDDDRDEIPASPKAMYLRIGPPEDDRRHRYRCKDQLGGGPTGRFIRGLSEFGEMSDEDLLKTAGFIETVEDFLLGTERHPGQLIGEDRELFRKDYEDELSLKQVIAGTMDLFKRYNQMDTGKR